MENSVLIESYLYRAKQQSNFTSEDLVGIFSPILSQLEQLHQQDLVALHLGLESFTENNNHRLRINEETAVKSFLNSEKLNEILPNESKSFDIISEQDMLKDISNNQLEINELEISEEISDQIIAPVFVPAYKSFETLLGHHDPLTDIHVLGLIMASMAMSLDLRDKKDVNKLHQVIKNPGYAKDVVHPNILKLIIDMVQLDRRKRIRDAYSVRIRLENYLEYSYNTQEDINSALAQYSADKESRNKWILTKLRNRLFDLSRRNKLIYFKKSSRYVNLTLASVPYVLDYHNIRPEKLILWNKDIADILQSSGKIKLNKYLQLKKNPQIGISLKKVYYEGNRDTAEYGFNQLKLAFAFLNWYNYKENPNEKIQSPLLFLPVVLKKRKGINDDFVIELKETEALVNPVLSHYLKELFDIHLPKSYDLNEVDIQKIYQDINQKITSKSNEVTMDFVDKPKLRIIHSQAKRSYEAYQKKVRQSMSKAIWKANGEYSYNPSDYRPFGVKLYKSRVRKQASLVEFLIDSDIKMEQNAVDNSINRDFFQIESDGNINPYLWEFDLCNFTLGNFNYQKMTLAHDYDQIIEEDIDNQIFKKLFSEDPKEIYKAGDDAFQIDNNYCVIPADATQLGAIQASDETGSYIIQGPPGTGKSQTIVNLLANEAAKGNSVLFISEKRAALDVVYARMSQIGLKDVCTLIHDSQSDKKPFIQDLKYTYETYAKDDNQWATIAEKREDIIAQLQKNIGILESFHQYQKYADNGFSTREIVDILINSNFKKNKYQLNIFEQAPAYHEWMQYKENLLQIEKNLQSQTGIKLLSDYPYFHLSQKVSKQLSIDFVNQQSNTFEKELSTITNAFSKYLGVNIEKFSKIAPIVKAMNELSVLQKQNMLTLLDPNSELTTRYQKAGEDIAKWQAEIDTIEEKNRYWTQKPSQNELKRLLSQYKEVSGGFFNKLLGKKEEFHKKLSSFYDFETQLVPPEIAEVLNDLVKEYELKDQMERQLSKLDIATKISSTQLAEHKRTLAFLQELTGQNELIYNARFINGLENANTINDSYNSVVTLKETFAQNIDYVDRIFDLIDELRLNASSLYGMAPRLREWFEISEKLRQFILSNQLKINDIAYISAYKQLLKATQQEGAAINGSELTRVVERIKSIYPKLLKINSKYIKETIKKQFQDALDLSFMPVYEMTKEQKEKKNLYHEGRAILENEFNKKIRYKSIRDLIDEASGVIIKDLKPVWMMSPLSVSDTLPLIENFDVVIFDEASQITVEEGIPPLFRAKRAIIVGDEMQMPPSNFFSTKIEDDDDDEAEYLSMDAESLLNQGARKLPQVTLGWHYRSRQEALINYSNFAFYHGELFTIPDVYTPDYQTDKIEVYKPEDAIENVQKVYQNSISYHYLPTGIYDNRMNDAEAEYIAHLVREMLLSDNQKSLGIVAFSMQQQSNIENALNQLAIKDNKFALALEEAFTGSNGEEFTGLFVKNLENVQGDERDIMILSICYGYNPKGRMLMNFGPINRRGGEKRLNVIFSRAKHHMVVVSSIKHNDITNEYNEGANHLKKYLQYTEYISLGEHEIAQSILHSLGRRNHFNQNKNKLNWLTEIKTHLEQNDYFVQTNLGQSRLKIDLGIKKDKKQERFDLGILIDHTENYNNKDVLSQYYTIPEILHVFGWKIYKIYANDWLHNKQIILQHIIDVLENKIIETTENTEADSDILDENEEISKENIIDENLVKTELIHQGKQKFWHISLADKKVSIQMGSIGDTGISNDYFFDSEAEAKEYYDTQISSRKSRGFEVEKTNQ